MVALVQMQTQSRLPLFLLFIILIGSFSVSLCQKNVTLFRSCSKQFRCGEKFPDIHYPFWGGERPRECGEEGFLLTCVEDDHVTIDIAGRTFLVVGINSSSYALTIASNGLWNGGCPDDYGEELNLDGSPFSLSREELQLVKLYSDCPGRESDGFSCKNRENATTDYFFDGSGCAASKFISVPALRIEVEKFNWSSDVSRNLSDFLYKGFSAQYTAVDWVACIRCIASDGLCWPGKNLQNQPTCLCSDGSHDLPVCKGWTRNNTSLKIFIGVGASACSALILFVAYVFKHKQSLALVLRRKTKEDRNLEQSIKQYGSFAVERYTYSYIKKMTSSFKEKLGQGGYGTVYRGKLFDGRLVAVKLLNVLKENGEEFINEVMSISRTSHVNVVRLLGFCMEGKRRALVYEYMSNGSLEKYIHCKKSEPMSINQLEMDKLYRISLGVARGLEYLHRGCNTRIMHFDIKPHNILLDENFCPKISDFGMSKQCKMNESIVSIMGARGTIGYIAPELLSRAFGVVSYKSDVYSYGMMVLEIVGRRKNVSLETSHASEVYFPHWAYQHLVIDNDLRLRDVTPEEDGIARKIILVGLWCVQNDPSLRPTMSKAIEMLEGELQAITMPPNSFFGFPPTPIQTSSTDSTTIVAL